MTVIEVEAYNKLPLGVTHVWVTALTYEDARRQVTRPVGKRVYHWKNVWAFEVVK